MELPQEQLRGGVAQRRGALLVEVAAQARPEAVEQPAMGVRVALPAYHPGGHNTWVEGEGDQPRLGEAGRVVSLTHKAGDFDTTITYSAQGLRESRPLGESTAKDLFVVGDSFAFGYGVEATDRFSNQLEPLLDRTVYNISIPEDLEGYAKLVRYAESHGATINELVIAVCMENDLWDYSQDRTRPAKGNRSPLKAAKVWLNGNSALYRYTTTLLNQTAAFRNLLVGAGLAGDYDQSVGGTPLADVVVATSVSTLKKLTDTRPSTVLIIPSRGLWAGAGTETARRNHDAFVNAAREAGMTLLDMRPHFEEGGEPLQYHFEHDGHWNAAGHQLAAQKLAERLAP